MKQSVLVVAGLVLFLDGIGLFAFCLGADRLGLGQGYGIGRTQAWGMAAGVVLVAVGLLMLLLQALRLSRARTAEGNTEHQGGASSPEAPEEEKSGFSCRA